MNDDPTQSSFSEIHRLLLLLFDKCKTPAQLRAQRRAQKAAMEFETELKEPNNK